MEKLIATRVFETLSSAVRLDVYRLLVRQGSAGLVAGEIAAALALPASNLSFHLKSMVHSGVLMVEQEGRYMRYRANLALMRDLITYLTAECCDGNLAQCPELLAQTNDEPASGLSACCSIMKAEGA